MDLIKGILVKNNYEVETALSGKQALAVTKTFCPDLILLDIIMPEMDGRDVLVELKKNEETKDIPIIMVTAKGDQFDRDYCLELGAYEYITKPCDNQVILRQIANVLEKNKRI